MFGSGEMMVVAAVIMLIFGSSQIPKLAKNLGMAQRELKKALGEDEPETSSQREAPDLMPSTDRSAVSETVAGPAGTSHVDA